MFQKDSTEVKTVTEVPAPSLEDHHDAPAHHQTTYQVLHELPRDATPAQQDSAIQSLFGGGRAPIHAVEADSTNVLILTGNEEQAEKVDLPQYYRENFFSTDSLLHPELNGDRYGTIGDPVPYTIRGDNMITALLILGFAISFVAFSKAHAFIVRQLKNLFRVQRSGVTVMGETTNEFRLQLFLTAQTCLMLSLVVFFYAREYYSDTFLVSSQYQLIAIFFGVFAAYVVVRLLLYAIVNWVFFEKKESEQWMKTLFFLTSMEGTLMFPMVVSQAYFHISLHNTIYYVIGVILLSRLLSLYKCFLIFFRHKRLYIQIILYFCALEIIPLLALGGALKVFINYLNINV